jgi:hypothetical protein
MTTPDQDLIDLISGLTPEEFAAVLEDLSEDDKLNALKAANIANLTYKFIELRDAKAAMQARHDAEMEGLDNDMQLIRDELRVKILALKDTQTVKTVYGTVVLRVDKKYRVRDQGELYTWVKETGNIDVLQMRLATTNLAKFLEQREHDANELRKEIAENQAEFPDYAKELSDQLRKISLPDGVDFSTEYNPVVTKPRSKPTSTTTE